jgi:hypothetical protein
MAAPEGNQNAAKDYIGVVYGHLMVIENLGVTKNRRILKCRCVCGVETIRQAIGLNESSSCGCEQRRKIGLASRGNTNRRGQIKAGLEAIERPSILDIAWAAGIWEGEGSVTGPWATRKDGYRYRQIQATVCQADPWLIERFRALFGGTIRIAKAGNYQSNQVSRCDISVWTVTGARARGFLMTIWKFLSPRRHAQILKGGFSFRET